MVETRRKTNRIRQNLLPLLAALIWGTAFVAQSVSTDFLGPLTFNAARAVIAFVVLSIILRLFPGLSGGVPEKAPFDPKQARRQLIIAGLCCGTLLTIASTLQQAALSETSVGKAGFITALYVVLVPVFRIFLRKRAPVQVWAGVALAVAGLYLLCMKQESFTVERGDALVLLCAVVFSFHILCVDHFVQMVDGVRLSCTQFLVMTLLSGAGMLLFEQPSWANILRCLPALLYVGVLSSGVAYTLQILAQRDADPTVVSLLLSLESVFSVLAGAVILGDRLTAREYAGCVLMFAAVVLSQLPSPRYKKDAFPR